MRRFRGFDNGTRKKVLNKVKTIEFREIEVE